MTDTPAPDALATHQAACADLRAYVVGYGEGASSWWQPPPAAAGPYADGVRAGRLAARAALDARRAALGLPTTRELAATQAGRTTTATNDRSDR